MSSPDSIRPIPGCSGYLVSVRGDVYSCCRPSKTARIGKRWHLLKHVPNPWGYPTVNVAGRCRPVHKLVAEAFLGPCPEGLECRHLDGNAANCALSNLVYGTSAENKMDMKRHGTRRCGEAINFAKLTAGIVLEIRRRGDAGEPVRAIARRFNLSPRHVRDLIKRQRWAHL